MLKSIEANLFVQLEVPPRRYIINPFLPERGLAEVFARSGIGKTTFALTLASAAALGQSFQKWKVNRPWKVLYIDGEMSTGEMQERVNAAAKYFGSAAPNNLRLLCHDREEGGLPDIGDEDEQYWFEEDIMWADLIFLDNLSCLLWSGRENDADSWSVMQQWLLRLRAAGKSIVMLHHSGKNGSSRGTSRRHDVLDTVIKLDRPFNYTQQEGAKFELHFEKTRGFSGEDAEPIGLSHTILDGISCWESFSIGTEKAEEVANLLKQGLSQNEIATQLGISQGEVSKRKGVAASKGII
ncbi:MAG: AAA family ATPase [Candidatus Puniceispirillum sp.]